MVGGGGGSSNDGFTSSMRQASATLIYAGGGHGANGFTLGEGGQPDFSAAIHRFGGGGDTFGAAAFGANFCPNGSDTGHGGGAGGGGNAGYVLLTW
jgi:hypothetical protein